MAANSCLRELSMSTPTMERYHRHKYVEKFISSTLPPKKLPSSHAFGATPYMPREAAEDDIVMKRPYTWAPAEDYTRIKVRMVTDKIKPWVPVDIPKKGAVIKFLLDAHLRAWLIENGHRVGKNRVSNTNYIANLEWIEHQSVEIGLLLKGKDYEPIPVPVDYPENPFVKTGSRFSGVAIMQDTERFLHALTVGIGDAKAWGFGFMNFRVVG